jgi:DNA-binding protein YbaB
VSDWALEVERNADRYRRLQQHLARMSITETSRDGAVRVTVSASGLLTDLALDERAAPKPLSALAAQVLETLRRAQAKIPDLVSKAVADVVGTADAQTHLIVADARKRFPEPPPDQSGWPVRRQPEPGGGPPPPRHGGGDDWAESPDIWEKG